MGIRLKLLVACLAALFLAQVGWWGYTIWNQGESKREATLVGLETRKEAAHATWEAAGGTARSWESIAVRFSGITLIEVDGQPRLKIEEAKLSSLARDRDGMRRMLFAEGGFFLLLAIGFLLLLFRAIQMEARLSREHTRFLHTVTHELRTPLQALKLASETLALENSPEQLLVARCEDAVDPVVGRHHRAHSRLAHRRLEGHQVEFAKGALADLGTDAVALEFRVVADEMLDAGPDAAGLDATDESDGSSGR